jgi:hypothetical protein
MSCNCRVALLDVDPSPPRKLQFSMSMRHQIYIAGSLPAAFEAASYFGRINGDPNTNRPCPILVTTLPGGYALYLQTMYIATTCEQGSLRQWWSRKGYRKETLTVFEKAWSIDLTPLTTGLIGLGKEQKGLIFFPDFSPGRDPEPWDCVLSPYLSGPIRSWYVWI